MENTYQKECGTDAVLTESSCEYILPDYQGDIKKILSAEARAIPSGRFIGEREVELAGIVTYDVLYADGEGRLTNASFTSDYELSLPISEGATADAAARTEVQSLSLRLSGPRKITARCALTSHVSVIETAEIGVGGSAFSAGHAPERLEQVLSVRRCAFGCGEEREYAEEALRTEEARPEEIEVVSAGGEVIVERAESAEGGVLLGGYILLHAIIVQEGCMPRAVRREIPFEETVPIGEAMPQDSAHGRGVLTSVTSAVRAEGESGSAITLSCVAEFSAEVERNEPLSVVTDAYVKEAESAAGYREFCYEELVAQVTEGLPVSGTAPLTEEELPLREIFHAAVSARVTEKSAEGRCATVRGDCVLTCVAGCCDEAGRISYGDLKISLPFEGKLHLPVSVGEGARVDCEITPYDAVCKLNGDSLLGECRLLCCATVTEEKRLTVLDTLEVGEPYAEERDGTVVTVCYPTPEDTLWSVAKRYHTTVRQIAVDNALTEEVATHMGEAGRLTNVKKLFV